MLNSIFENISKFTTSAAASVAITISTVFPGLPFLQNNPNILFDQAIANFKNLKSVHYESFIDADYSTAEREFELESAETGSPFSIVYQGKYYPFAYPPLYVRKITGVTDENIKSKIRKSRYSYEYDKSQPLYSDYNFEAVILEPQNIYLFYIPLTEWERRDIATDSPTVQEVFKSDYVELTKFLLDNKVKQENIGDEIIGQKKVKKYQVSLNTNKLYKTEGEYDAFTYKLYRTFLYNDRFDPTYFVWVDTTDRQIVKTELEWKDKNFQKITVNFSNFDKPVDITEPKGTEKLIFNEPDIQFTSPPTEVYTNIDPNCPNPHDENKKYSVAGAAENLGSMLKVGLNSSYNKFKCKPNSNAIPQKAREVYELSETWNPVKNPEDYVQCIAFAFMTYNMVNNPITKKTGNAISLAGKKYVGGVLVDDNTYTDQFNVYESGKTKELPKVGDLMVWKVYAPDGHVGIITKVSSNLRRIRVYSSNSINIYDEFEYNIDGNNNITINSDRKWRPSYWSRKK